MHEGRKEGRKDGGEGRKEIQRMTGGFCKEGREGRKGGGELKEGR
jgi:hypothetical protein